ncbi:MAG TPA: deoxyhypusine synthase family protein [Planctomycetaceae bacterium]|nr:deoxyhypusine synthase family protein [Planctomycetaceae bacterium]
MHERELHDGRKDGLLPLESLDLGSIGSFRDLLRAMSKTAFAGRNLGEAFNVMLEMIRDSDARVVMTITGAMTVAKQGKIVCDLIDRGIVHAVIATGALMAHGLTESIGLAHYRYNPKDNDKALYEKGYNRIYDTLEMEENLNSVERLMSHVLDHAEPEDGVWSSARLCREIGRVLHNQNEGPGILKSAFERNVPVFIPAFTDSELGLDVSTWAMGKAVAASGKNPAEMTPEEIYKTVPPFNPFYDLQEYARFIGSSDRVGILTIGGGVPRNWAQQVAPYYDITNHRIGTKFAPPRYRYGVRICPEPVHWGGLSGCTYSEGVSWGKFLPIDEGGRFAEVYADATVVLPLLVKAVFEELDSQGKGTA